MVIILPRKIYQTLSPAIKGNVGAAREVNFAAFLNVFTGYFGCTVAKRQGNRFKVSPPPPGQGIWYWDQVPFFVHKPADGVLRGGALYRQQKTLKDQYNWNKNTFTYDGRRF